jgi:predicted dehydrogenase
MASDIGVGIIGFGLAAKVFHAPFISAVPGLSLKVFVERSSNAAAQAYPHTRTVRSVEELLADPAIHLVIVATPNPTHFALASQALRAGKHVVIDKPFAGTSAEADQLIQLAARHNVIVAPFHNRRWDGDFLTVQKILAEGHLGRLVTFESHFDRYRPIQRENTWKEAGDHANGLLYDLGPHLVDQVVALFGMPQTVNASVRTDRDKTDIEDAFDIWLGYDHAGPSSSKLLAWCRSSMLACDASPRFLLHGTAGSFKKFGLDPQEPALVAGAKVPEIGSSTPWLPEAEEHFGTLTIAPNLADPATLNKTVVPTLPGDYRNFYRNVRDTILGTAQLAIPSSDGRNVIHLLELARRSSAEARTLPV